MRTAEFPTERDRALLRTWRRRYARVCALAAVLLLIGAVALACWAFSDSTRRGLLLGHGDQVTVAVAEGSVRTGNCSSRGGKGPDRFNVDVVVRDPMNSTVGAGHHGVISLCGLPRPGTVRTATVMSDGAVTASSPTSIRWGAVATTLCVAMLFGLIWLCRREGRAADRAVQGDPSRALVLTASARFPRSLLVTTETGLQLLLGLPLIDYKGRLLRWRYRAIPLPDSARYTAVFLGAPNAGTPVLLVDSQGQRHWRTVQRGDMSVLKGLLGLPLRRAARN